AEPAAPPGLARALERLGEPCWSAEDYQALLRVLASRAGGKPLRHAEAITPAQVRVLDRLPTPLLDQGLGGRVKTDVAAALIAEAWRAIASRDGEAVASALPARWGAADGPKALAELIVDDLEPAVAPPPFPGSERLRPLADKAALVDAAKRYRNCLRRELCWAGQGVSAYYEWIEAPGAVVEITNDRLYGWSLEQARTVGNDPVPEPIRAGIIAELRAWGVRVGRPVWWLINDLREAAENPRAIIDDEAKVIAELFGD
ncbi:MAG: hypothetical protein P4M09_09330, partial [Devosia sp.]|nr:hypothetical protein [Devosia sp.]